MLFSFRSLRGAKLLSFFLCLALLVSFVAPWPSAAQESVVMDATGAADNETTTAPQFDFDAKSVILVEAGTGKVLYEENADEALPPASVTKIMTLLLVMEAIDEGRFTMDDTVPISEYAAGMGGSQVYLEPGETFTVRELLKCVTVASANDAAVALAEFVGGSCDAFVAKMNERAKELGMNHTTFENPTGLDDQVEKHLTSARDIAIMSCELLKHPAILDFTGIWMDSIRDGSFGLTNTNRLIRFYQGANGLKTGSTAKAKFCISATALRDGMQLVAVVMGSSTRDARNSVAKTLLDYGFATYSMAVYPTEELEAVPVKGSLVNQCRVSAEGIQMLTKKGAQKNIRVETDLPEVLTAPIHEGDPVGTRTYYLDDVCIGSTKIYAMEEIAPLTYAQQLARILKNFWIL